MKITSNRLRQIIKEELQLLCEISDNAMQAIIRIAFDPRSGAAAGEIANAEKQVTKFLANPSRRAQVVSALKATNLSLPARFGTIAGHTPGLTTAIVGTSLPAASSTLAADVATVARGAGALAGVHAAGVIGWKIGKWLDDNGASLFDDEEFEGDYMEATKEMRSMGPMEAGRAIADALGVVGDNEGAIFAGFERLEKLRSERGCAAIRRAASAGAEKEGVAGPAEFWQEIYDSLDGVQRSSFTRIFAGWGRSRCTPPNFRFNQ